MRVDCARNVFEHRPHFQGQREFAGKFGNMPADRLYAQDAAIIPPCDNADETLAAAGRKCATIGGEGETGDDRFNRLGRRLTGGEPDRDDFRLGKADRGNGDRIEASGMTGDDLSDHMALGCGLVFEHGLAHKVADGPNAAHRCRAAVVDLDEPIRQIDAHRLQPPAFKPRPAADGDQYPVGGNRLRSAVHRHDLKPVRRMPGCPGAEVDADAMGLQPSRHRGHQFSVIKRKQPVLRFDDGHRAAEFTKCDPQFEPDIAAADNGERGRQFLQRQRLCR